MVVSRKKNEEKLSDDQEIYIPTLDKGISVWISISVLLTAIKISDYYC